MRLYQCSYLCSVCNDWHDAIVNADSADDALNKFMEQAPLMKLVLGYAPRREDLYVSALTYAQAFGHRKGTPHGQEK